MKKYKKLRIELAESEYTRQDLAKLFGHSIGYIQERYSGRYSFSLRDVYILCSELEIPFEKIPEYWPVEEVLQCER